MILGGRAREPPLKDAAGRRTDTARASFSLFAETRLASAKRFGESEEMSRGRPWRDRSLPTVRKEAGGRLVHSRVLSSLGDQDEATFPPIDPA